MGKGGTGDVSVAALMAAQHGLLAGSWGQPSGACSSGRACPSAAGPTCGRGDGWKWVGSLGQQWERGERRCLAGAAVLPAAWPLGRAVGSCQPCLGVQGRQKQLKIKRPLGWAEAEGSWTLQQMEEDANKTCHALRPQVITDQWDPL